MVEHGRVADEIEAVRERVGLLDRPGFSRFLVEGRGAPAYLDHFLCTRLPARGRVAHGYALTPQGGTLCAFTLARLDPERFLLWGAGEAGDHDFDALDAARPRDGAVKLTRQDARFATLVVAGPRARDLLDRVAADDVSDSALPPMSWRHIDVAEVELMALRLSSLGELGFELHAPAPDMPALCEAIRQAGQPFGLAEIGPDAREILRLEKGYPAGKRELDADRSPFAAALDRYVALDKGDFVGRAALVEEKRRWPEWRLVTLTLDAPGAAPTGAPVFAEGGQIGVVTSGGWSPGFATSVALAYLRPSLAQPDQRVEIEVLGERRAGQVRRTPLYDPDNLRLRG